MTTTTTNTTTANIDTPITFCLWDNDALFLANFMFPTEHFKDADSIKSMEEKEFCELIEEMLTVCQPLREIEQKELVKSVMSGNRLRVYYQAYNLAKSSIAIANEVQLNDSETGSLDDDQLNEAFEFRGHQVLEESDQLQRDNEDHFESIILS